MKIPHPGHSITLILKVVQMWRYSDSPVTFNIGETAEGTSNSAWRSIWRLRPPTPVTFLAFSADGTLFATAGAQDRLVCLRCLNCNSLCCRLQVRIWYQNQQLLLPGQTLDSASEHITFSFIYVAHPRPVTGFSWRETSR